MTGCEVRRNIAAILHMGAETTFTGWLTTGWTSADVIGLAITLGGLGATFWQAMRAKNVAEETRENVSKELGRVKGNIASFNLLAKIHSAVSAIDSAKDALIAKEHSRAVGQFEIIYENLTLLSVEEFSCVLDKQKDIDQAILYLNEKIDNIGEQISKNKITEQTYKVSQVLGNIKSMLKLVEQGLIKEAFDGGK